MGSIISLVIDLYIYVLLVRCLMPLISVGGSNPFIRSVFQLTDPLIKPVQKFLPQINYPEFSTLVVAVLLKCLGLLLLSVFAGYWPGLLGLIIWSAGQLINAFVMIYFVSLLVEGVMSWIPIPQYVSAVVIELNRPLLALIRSYVPVFKGIDFSPFAAIIVLQIIRWIVVAPIVHMGKVMAFA